VTSDKDGERTARVREQDPPSLNENNENATPEEGRTGREIFRRTKKKNQNQTAPWHVEIIRACILEESRRKKKIK
jgi:hypothetical protein